ncbi:hypothetical protein EYR40_002142 [Pleurotus pulmonarius]|nr:hypothetical protein EYR36_011451 [Pleurotus pulmonarius]KAF4585305.1 hypothetical protein EYR40_002142 [Pleurotus pulmonarius]
MVFHLDEPYRSFAVSLFDSLDLLQEFSNKGVPTNYAKLTDIPALVMSLAQLVEIVLCNDTNALAMLRKKINTQIRRDIDFLKSLNDSIHNVRHSKMPKSSLFSVSVCLDLGRFIKVKERWLQRVLCLLLNPQWRHLLGEDYKELRRSTIHRALAPNLDVLAMDVVSIWTQEPTKFLSTKEEFAQMCEEIHRLSPSTPPPFDAFNPQSLPIDRDMPAPGARPAHAKFLPAPPPSSAPNSQSRPAHGGTTSFRGLSLSRSLSRAVRVRIPTSFRARIVDNLRPRTHPRPPKSDAQPTRPPSTQSSQFSFVSVGAQFTRPPSTQSSQFSFVSAGALSGLSLSSFSLVEYNASLYDDDNCSLVPPASAASDPTPDPWALQSFCSIEHVASAGSIAVGPHQDRVLVIGRHINTITININPTIHGDCLSGPISNAIVGGRNNANHTSMRASEEPEL